MGISLNPATILSGQGIDVSSIVSQIVSEQSGQLSVWEGQQTTLATKASTLGSKEDRPFLTTTNKREIQYSI